MRLSSLLVGVAVAFGTVLPGCTPSVPEGPPNVVLIVLDTTRADRLSVNGYGKDTTPNLVSFAKEAIRFDRAYATSPWTVASHASLFTGLLPATHRATQSNVYLDEELVTLAELLGSKGFETAAFTNNSWISKVTNLTQGFDLIEPMWRSGGKVPASGFPHPTNEAVAEWLTTRDDAKPFFLFLNYIEPHWPFKAPDAFRARFDLTGASKGAEKRSGFPAISWYLSGRQAKPEVLATRSAMYDAEVAYLDAVIGELMESLDDAGVLEDALVVITADHGEHLGENSHMGHSFTVHEAAIRVPLLVRRPRGRDGGTVREDPVQITDAFVTIARAAGVETLDARGVGIDLLSTRAPEDRPIIAEYDYPKTFLDRFPKNENADRAVAPFKRQIRSIRIGPEKLIWGSDESLELYDVVGDPGEQSDLFASRAERARELEAILNETVERASRPIVKAQPLVSEMDEATIANLRALGYLP